MIKKRVFCQGFLQEDTTQRTVRFIINRVLSLTKGRGIIFSLTPEECSSYSLQTLIEYPFSKNTRNEKDQSLLLPISINIIGNKRNEPIRTKWNLI